MSGLEPMDAASSKAAMSTFKPTLESFSSALDNENTMDELNMSIGKSVFFDAAQYHHHFGAPKIPIERTPPPRSFVSSQPRSWDTQPSPSKQEVHARRDRHNQQTSLLWQHSSPSATSRLHPSSAAPRNRPTSSSPSSRASTTRLSVSSTTPSRKNDDARTSSSDPQFLLTGKSALSPTKRSLETRK